MYGRRMEFPQGAKARKGENAGIIRSAFAVNSVKISLAFAAGVIDVDHFEFRVKVECS